MRKQVSSASPAPEVLLSKLPEKKRPRARTSSRKSSDTSSKMIRYLHRTVDAPEMMTALLIEGLAGEKNEVNDDLGILLEYPNARDRKAFSKGDWEDFFMRREAARVRLRGTVAYFKNCAVEHMNEALSLPKLQAKRNQAVAKGYIALSFVVDRAIDDSLRNDR